MSKLKLFSKVDEEDTSGLEIKIGGGMTLPSLNSDGGMSFNLSISPEEPKKTTKRSSSKKSSAASNAVKNAVTDTVSAVEMDDMLTTNKPYQTKYDETTMLLKTSIGQLDGLLAESINDANQIRASKTLKRKYDLLSLLNNNASSIIGNKITAIREINNTISKCNDLELKRRKELSLAAAGENSDKKIMDMYSAFVSMPSSEPGVANMQSITNSLNMGNVITGSIIGGDDMGYQQYVQNMSPAQRLNMYESNPDVKQVVVYNQQNGSRYFEVMNMATGEVIPGVDKHDAMFLEGVTLDLENKIARNIDLGETYPIVVVGEPVMNMY